MADVQKINKELEKLQLSDEESVFEEALVSPDVRDRCHQKGSGHDMDLAAFENLSQSSASFLSPRSAMNEELLRDLARTPPSAFLKASNESTYLSILPKVKEAEHRDWDCGPRTMHLHWPRDYRHFIMLAFQNVFSEASIEEVISKV